MRTYGSSKWSWPGVGVMAVSEAIVTAYATQRVNGLITFAVLTGVSLGAASVGAAGGFLFGIPRSNAANSDTTATPARYQPNTNLEQVSDWLTKLLIGAALVQLARVGTELTRFGETLRPLVGEPATVLVPSIVLINAIAAFALVYLWTRLYLLRQLSEADGDAGPEFYLALMNAHLYVKPPQGFAKVIDIADRFRKELGGDARYWRYLAYACGQRYAWEQRVGRDDEETLAPIRARALDATARALAIDPSLGPRMRQIWRPAPAASDDDLAAFRSDAEFEKLFASHGL